MAVTPKGVRMINDNVIQDGLGLVVNKRDVMDWNHIPNGSLYINPETGVMMTKIAGETDWVPAGLKNDGTLVISRDTSLHVEVFKIISINNSTHKFVYEDAQGRRQTKTKDADGFVFQLDGSYMPGRNHLMVTFDDVLDRSAASGGIVELDEHRFRVTEDIPVGTEVTAKYIQWVRIGNPYPRWYEAYDEPTAAEVGDFFLDLDDTVESNFGNITAGQDTPVSGNIAWSRITGKPTTLAGYGITDRVSLQGHTHSTSDITGLDNYVTTRVNNALSSSMGSAIDSKIQTLTTKLTNGTIKVKNATHADTADTATSAARATQADSATTAATATNATKAISAEKIIISGTTYNLDTAKAGGSGAANKIAVYDANGQIPVAALPAKLKNSVFVKGMIIDWFGASNAVPAGWKICDGTNGTPDLRGKFIIGGGTTGSYLGCTTVANTTADNKKYNGGNATGKTTGTATIKAVNLPPHSHKRGSTEIKGTFPMPKEAGKDKNNHFSGAFVKGGETTGSWSADVDKQGSILVNFNLAEGWTGSTTSFGGNTNGKADPLSVSVTNIMPPYVALFKIMYVGV